MSYKQTWVTRRPAIRRRGIVRGRNRPGNLPSPFRPPGIRDEKAETFKESPRQERFAAPARTKRGAPPHFGLERCPCAATDPFHKIPPSNFLPTFKPKVSPMSVYNIKASHILFTDRFPFLCRHERRKEEDCPAGQEQTIRRW